jgi:hypothetical protein
MFSLALAFSMFEVTITSPVPSVCFPPTHELWMQTTRMLNGFGSP